MNAKPFLVLFTGHRDRWADPADLERIYKEHLADAPFIWMHGGATGFDNQVEGFAKAVGVATLVVRPDYQRYGFSAPLKRNDLMLSLCDCVVALYDGREKGGTFYTLNRAKKLKLPLEVLTPNEHQPF